MSQLQLIEATSNGFLVGEIELGLEFANFAGEVTACDVD